MGTNQFVPLFVVLVAHPRGLPPGGYRPGDSTGPQPPTPEEVERVRAEIQARKLSCSSVQHFDRVTFEHVHSLNVL